MAALSELVICQMALSHLGVTQTLEDTGGDGELASSTDASLAKSLCDLWYERCRDRALAEWPWQFARKFVLLTLVSDDTDELWSYEWRRAFGYPSDCLKARRFVKDQGWGYWLYGYPEYVWPYRGSHWAFVRRVHEGADVLLTNVDELDAQLEYTEQVTDPTRFSEQFAEALAWLVAANIATPLTNNTQNADRAQRYYDGIGAQAQATLLQEERSREEPDGTFLQARGWIS